MNAAVATATPGGGAAFVFDIEALLARLPASVRARITWVRTPINEGMRRLRTEPLTDELLDDVAGTVMQPLQALSRTFIEMMAENRDELRAILMEDLERDAKRLQDFVQDPDAADTAEWVLGFVRSFFVTVLTLIEPARLAELDSGALEEAMRDPDARSFMRGHIAVMGAIDGAKNEASRERVAELIDVAYLHLMEVRDQMRRVGVWVSPFPEATAEQRRQDALRYAQRFRELVTDDDWRDFGQARLGNLR